MAEMKKSFSLILNAIKLSLTTYWHVNKALIFCCLLAVVLRVALPYAGIYMPKVVIDLIQQQVSASSFILTVGGLAFLMEVMNYGKSFTDVIVDRSIGTTGIFSFLLKTIFKQINMDYEQLEHPDFKAVMDKSEKAVDSNHALAMNIPRSHRQSSPGHIDCVIVLFGSQLVGSCKSTKVQGIHQGRAW